MSYKALYRTYRPSTFEEVAGQQHIVKTLKNALKTNKIAHAYLFAGPRGTGKTTMAKLLAKALNCDHGIGCQCNECKNCKAIIEGSHPDVLEIDAASNRGINEIKELIERVKYSTILGRYKVYIIDEVHMMTNEAFNALLKTLEEPPEHVIFILATTEPHKILPTILSRCQRYDFTKVSDEDIKERIKTILELEKISYNDEAVNTIISLADGGMRDALSILDQVLAYSGNTLNEEDILSIFALESKEEKIGLIKSIANHDVSDVLSRLSNYIQKGSDIKRLTNDILVILKDALIYSLTYRKDLFQFINEEDAKELVQILTSDRMIEMIDILLNATKEYKQINDIKPLFEVTLLKLSATKNATLHQVFETRQEEVKPIEKPVEIVEKPVKVEEIKPVIHEVKVEQNDKEEIKERAEEIAPDVKLDKKALVYKSAIEGDHFAFDTHTLIRIMVSSRKDNKNYFLEHWKDIKKLISHPVLGKYASLLADAYPLVVSNKILIVEFQLSTMVEKINLLENQAMLQNVVETALNKKLFIYGVSRKDSVDLQRDYRNLYEVGKLPKASDDDFILEEE
ncbi:MAG: DNA polymerase III subunit gamma/tau [Bacilli bacterium]|nr:DNA polymerase III subunit gamma/tau [Bacilli bacterium]